MTEVKIPQSYESICFDSFDNGSFTEIINDEGDYMVRSGKQSKSNRDINQITEEIKKIYEVVYAAISLVDAKKDTSVSADIMDELVNAVNSLRKVED